MNFLSYKVSDRSGKAGRVILIALASIIAIILVLTILVFPKMSSFFLKKGLAFTEEKVVATLPADEGYNPELHKYDPLEVKASFAAIRKSLELDTMKTDALISNLTDFMNSFRVVYDDQLITLPDEQVEIITALTKLEKSILKEHFIQLRINLFKFIEIAFPENPDLYQAVIGFDSISIYNDQITMGMTGPITLQLINSWYEFNQDGELTAAEREELIEIFIQLDRYQLKNEFTGAAITVFEDSGFTAYVNYESFKENTAIIINKLRDSEYDYQSVRPTLKSFIFVWYAHINSPESEQFDFETLYKFTEYAKDHALAN